MELRRVLNNKTLRNAGWIVGGRLTNKLLVFVVGILTARYLGPANNGLLDYAAAYVTFCASLCALGIPSVIIKDFVDHPEEEGEAIGTALVLRLGASLLCSGVVVGIVSVIDRGEPMTVLVVALSCIGLVFRAFETFKQWFQSRLQSKYAAIATVAAYGVCSAYKLLLLARGRTVAWFAAATSVEFLVLGIILVAAYRKMGGQRLRFSRKKAGELLRLSSGFIVSGLMVSVYASTDKLMLKQLMDGTAVACYSLAVTLSTTWGFVLEAVNDSAYPSILQAYGKDQDLFNRRNRQLYALIIYGCLAVSLLICLLAEPIVLFLYGQAYAPAVAPLRIVVWYATFSYLGGARNAWIVCENKQKYLQYLYAAAALINVLLNLLLIPRWGPSGAAVASLVTQMATSVLLPAVIPPLRPNAKLMLEALLLRDVFPARKNGQ